MATALPAETPSQTKGGLARARGSGGVGPSHLPVSLAPWPLAATVWSEAAEVGVVSSAECDQCTGLESLLGSALERRRLAGQPGQKVWRRLLVGPTESAAARMVLAMCDLCQTAPRGATDAAHMRMRSPWG